MLNDPLFDADIASGSGNVWLIGGRKTLVAGTLTSDTTVPGRCVSPIDDVNANGVQLIFGGDSRMQINANGQASAVEICGSYHANRPPIAVYGQKTGSSPTATVIASGRRPHRHGRHQRHVEHLHRRDRRQPEHRGRRPGNQRQPRGVGAGQHRPQQRPERLHHDDGLRAGDTTCRWALSSPGAPEGHSPIDGQPEQGHVHPEPRPGHGRVHHAGPDQPRHRGHRPVPADRVGRLPEGACTTRDSPAPRCSFKAELGRTQTAQLDAVRLELTYYVPQLRGQTTTAITGNTVATVGGAPGHPGVWATRRRSTSRARRTPRCRRSTCRSTTSTSRSSGSA